MILDQIRKRWPWVKDLFADGIYDCRKLMGKAAFKDFIIEVIRPATPPKASRFYRLDGLWSEPSDG